jgi:hypothetical protein
MRLDRYSLNPVPPFGNTCGLLRSPFYCSQSPGLPSSYLDDIGYRRGKRLALRSFSR